MWVITIIQGGRKWLIKSRQVIGHDLTQLTLDLTMSWKLLWLDFDLFCYLSWIFESIWSWSSMFMQVSHWHNLQCMTWMAENQVIIHITLLWSKISQTGILWLFFEMAMTRLDLVVSMTWLQTFKFFSPTPAIIWYSAIFSELVTIFIAMWDALASMLLRIFLLLNHLNTDCYLHGLLFPFCTRNQQCRIG